MNAPMIEEIHRLGAMACRRGILAAGFACLLLAQAAAVAAEPAAPEILRGSSAPPPPAVAVGQPAADSADVVAAGNRVWFVDRAEGTLIGCRLINTSYVGVERIACSARDLPEAAR